MDKNSAAKLAKVHPVLSQKITQVIALAANVGLDVRVVQGLRTFEEQTKLYNQPWDKRDNDGDGRIDEKDEKVTNAKAGQSNHNYGLACDLCVFVNGKPDWNNLQNFATIGRLAKQVGLEWGGDWKFKDRPHVQLKGLSVKECSRLYQIGGIEAVWKRIDVLLAEGKPSVFVPTADDILEFGDIGGAVRELQKNLGVLGFLHDHEIDGEFGKITKNAVIAFQRQNKLTADGLAGPVTKKLLEKEVSEKLSFSKLDESEINLEIPENSKNSTAVPANSQPETGLAAQEDQQRTGEQSALPPSNTSAIFNAENISAFIPRIGKLKWLGLIPGAGLVSTVYAYFQNAPAELVFALGFFTGVTSYAFLQFIFKHREKVIDFIKMCYQTTADPAQHNLIPVNAAGFVGTRRNELLSSLNSFKKPSFYKNDENQKGAN